MANRRTAEGEHQHKHDLRYARYERKRQERQPHEYTGAWPPNNPFSREAPVEEYKFITFESVFTVINAGTSLYLMACGNPLGAIEAGLTGAWLTVRLARMATGKNI